MRAARANPVRFVVVVGNPKPESRTLAVATAAALADELPHAERMTPPLGHIGMIVARDAPNAVWAPLAHWLIGQGAA